jgi:membrane-bound lytic murein transglycosylase B
MKYFIVNLLIIIFLYPTTSFSNEEGFGVFISKTLEEARSKNVSERTINAVKSEITFLPNVIEKDKKQPESKITFPQYRKNLITKKRVALAKKALQENHALLDKIEKKFGVQKRFLVALWSIESGFGKVQGKMDILNSLASLAYDGRRAEFFKKEFINSLKILDEGHIERQNFKGSWAGAMGQCQFMPSTFNDHAFDFDGDGKKNIWSNKADALASMANYLKNIGWKGDETWGRKVKLSKNFDTTLVDVKQFKPLSEWRKLGVLQADGKPVSDSKIMARLISADKGFNPNELYLVYNNFDVVMQWNRSEYFATSVGILADKLK